MKCKILDIGITDYLDCYRLQKKLHNEVSALGRSASGGKNNEADDHVILTEHEPVMTIGRSGSKKNLLVSEEFLKSRNVKVIDTDRGGDITYHGPGQVIMYPIINLRQHFKDVHKYLHYLEETVIELLKEFNIDSFRINGKTGVWTKQGKIASIGIGVSGWITFHGVALNVDCDLTPFGWINPCGFKGIKVTSMEKIGKNGDCPYVDCPHFSKQHIKQRLIAIFFKKFNLISSSIAREIEIFI